MQKPESVQENEMHEFLYNCEIQMDNLIQPEDQN